MGVRATSIEAYRHLVESGGLAKKTAQVYAALYEFGPSTAGELACALEGGVDGRRRAVLSKGSSTNVSAYLNGLRERGVVRELGKKVCDITGREVIEWDVTSQIYPDPMPRETLGARRERRIAELEAEVAVWKQAAFTLRAILEGTS